jgi:hypothetical protein
MFKNTKRVIKADERCVSDNPSSNNNYVRESEAHGRITKVENHFRKKTPDIFIDVASPHSYCESHYFKAYHAE